MADRYKPDSDPTIQAYTEALQVSVDYVAPHWDVAARLYALWRGRRPWQLDGTFSKIMLNVAHGVEADRRPKLKDNILGNAQPIGLRAQAPEDEFTVEEAQSWVNYKLLDEDQINIRATIDPTLQSALVMGTGYREPYVERVPAPRGEGTVTRIGTRDVDFFDFLPAPTGGLVNPMDRWGDDALPYGFRVRWFRDDELERMSKLKGWNEAAFAQMKEDFKGGEPDDSALAEQYRERFEVIDGIEYSGSMTWRQRMASINGMPGQTRCVWWHRRDKCFLIAKDRYVLYEGKPLLGHGIIPIIKYAVVPDFRNWFGIGTLEMVEDLCLATLMNFNYRMDWLSRSMFPTKWIRNDVVGGRPASFFYDEPYKVVTFSSNVARIDHAVWYDRMPEITSQHFIEEDRIAQFLQQVTGLTDVAKGVAGTGADSATGVMTLTKAAEGRLTTESIQLEQEGLAQEARLLLALGDKHVTSREYIRAPEDRSGFGWQEIDPDAITSAYTIYINGTRMQSLNEARFQRLLAMYPLWNNNPWINQETLARKGVHIADVDNNPSDWIQTPQPIPQDFAMGGGSPPGGTPPSPNLGGAASAQNPTQRSAQQTNRQTVNQQGQAVAANPFG